MKFCFLLLLAASLQTPAQTSVYEDSLLARYYSERELEQLTILVDFFDGYVVQQTGEPNIQQAYETFNRQQASNKVIALTIPLDTVRVMFARVRHPVWNSIWKYGSSSIYRTRDSTRLIVPVIDLNLYGSFWKFLLILGKTDKQIEGYTRDTQAAGTLTPSLQGMYFDQVYPYKVDFARAANRLVAAVYYLTFHVQMMEQPQ